MPDGTTGNNNPLDLSQYISGVTNQAYTDWGTQQDQMNWAKSQFTKNAATADTVSGRALDTGAAFGDAAARDQAEYQTYQPARQKQLAFAMDYTTPERMAANRAGAEAQVATQTQAAREASERALASTGVDPSSGRYAGLDAGLAAKQAASSAAAGTTSDRTTEQLGQQYLAQAINTGAVLPGQATNEAGVGIAAGNQAVNAPLAATASGAATMGTPMQWNAAGNSMFNQWPVAANMQANAGLQQQQLDLEKLKQQQTQSSGTGAMIGAGLGILGSVAGSYFGGPAGGALGGTIGKSLGGAMSGGDSGGGQQFGPPSPFARGGMVRRGYAEGGSVEEEDMTDQYNTPLSDEDERRYHEWAAQNHREGDTFDYDMRGAWKGGVQGDPRTGHYPDTYKKPNHPTFSDESQYDGSEGRRGGHWEEDETGSTTLQPYGTHSHADGGMIDPEEQRLTDDIYARHKLNRERVDPEVLQRYDRMQQDRRERDTGYPWETSQDYEFPPNPRDTGNIQVLPETRRNPQSVTFRQGGGVSAMISAFANGGDIPSDPEGPADDGGSNMVSPEQSPSGGEETDDVHAMLNEGEFVMPKDVTSWYGEKFMQNLIKKARDEIAGPKAEGQPGPPVHAMALSPPTFRSEGARAGA